MLQHHPADEISQENLISDEVKMALDIKFRRELKRKLRSWRKSKTILENCDLTILILQAQTKLMNQLIKKSLLNCFTVPKLLHFLYSFQLRHSKIPVAQIWKLWYDVRSCWLLWDSLTTLCRLPDGAHFWDILSLLTLHQNCTFCHFLEHPLSRHFTLVIFYCGSPLKI